MPNCKKIAILDGFLLKYSKFFSLGIIMQNFRLKMLCVGVIFSMSCTSTPQTPVQMQPSHAVIHSSTGTTRYNNYNTGVQNPIQPPAPIVQQPRSYNSFADWKYDFINRAGANRATLERLLANAEYNERVVSSDRNQAEFTKMAWDYADSAVSSSRVSQGKRQYANQSSVLKRAESLYGTSASIVTAIWGMESSYGQGTGNASLASSLATLAYDGRRRDFAENQLIALAKLLERGDLDWSQLKGSWAGGMGHTQFIPLTWLHEGVDGNGDGRKSPFNTADALSSTASYLSNAGWVRGLSPFYEVRLPANFDFRQLNDKKTIQQWQASGLQSLNGSLPAHELAELWLPAGREGPALLITKNFNAIKVYNNSSNYALGVSLLARAIIGQGGLQQSFPRYEKSLSGYQVERLQQRLNALGYDTKGIDGKLGNNTRLAFWRWQLDNGQVADGFISERSAQSLLY